jgi:TM2 domain-containing membrane protein YozV
MYKIIGADGQPYGPVPLEQLLRWLAENRVNAQTLVQPEGVPDWRALATFPELADKLPPPPSAASPQPGTPPIATLAARPSPELAAKASTKIAAGICGILLGGLGIHKFILGYTASGLIMLLVSVLSCFWLWPVMAIIGLIEGIVYLTKTDEDFVRQYVEVRREWF